MASITRTVDADADDAQEDEADANFDATTATLTSLAANSVDDINVGMRFTNITIPAGRTISSATITINVVSGASDDINTAIYLNDVDSAANFTDEADVTGRVLTTATVTWSETGLGIGLATSPNFAAALQEVIDRGAWASGNAICVIFFSSGLGGNRQCTFSSSEGAGPSPALAVTFSGGAADPGGGGSGGGGGGGSGHGKGGGGGGGNNPGGGQGPGKGQNSGIVSAGRGAAGWNRRRGF